MHQAVSELAGAVGQAPTQGVVGELGQGLAAVLVGLVDAGAGGEVVGRAGGFVIDSMARRLIELCREEAGPPPTSYAWIALGSLGRCERTLIGDQDHALVFADPGSIADAYFAHLAEYVTSGLEQAGIPRCPSRVIATQLAFRRSRDDWVRQLESWIGSDQQAAFFAEIAFDYRRVAGNLSELVPQLDRLTAGAHHLAFLRRLAGLAISHPFPLHPLGAIDFEPVPGGGRQLDVKAAVINPMTELARFFALASGVVTSSTYRRLRQVAATASEWSKPARSLLPVFTELQNLRLRHQAREWAGSREVTNYAREEELTREERRLLHDSLRTMRRVQGGVQNWIDWTL